MTGSEDPARTGPFPPSAGGHALPAHLTDSTRVATGRRRSGPLLGVLGAVVVAAVLATAQLTASFGYDRAEGRLAQAAAASTSAKAAVGDENAGLETIVGAAQLIVRSDTGTLVDPAARDALSEAATGAERTAAGTAEVLGREISGAGEKPGWFWELFGATQALDAERARADDLTTALTEQSALIRAAGDTTTSAGLALLTAAAEAAPAFEAAHISARNDAVVALRAAAAAAGSAAAIDDQAAQTFAQLESAVAQVVSTEQEEMAEKAGALRGARLEIEAFARSIAPGVLLEFDWSPLVNGYGRNGSMGGYTTWWSDDPGRAAIELSNSVAEQWPSARSRALVAHEVGHAISVKCRDMYDSSTQEEIERWATAWAIGMGHTDEANGVWAYGYPPQTSIDAALACR